MTPGRDLLLVALLLVLGCGRFQLPPVIQATWDDDTGRVKALIEGGVAVDTEDVHGYTPLHVAAANGNVELVVFLLEHGAPVDGQTFERETPMALAGDQFCHLEESLKWAQAPNAVAEEVLAPYLTIRELLLAAGSDADEFLLRCPQKLR